MRFKKFKANEKSKKVPDWVIWIPALTFFGLCGFLIVLDISKNRLSSSDAQAKKECEDFNLRWEEEDGFWAEKAVRGIENIPSGGNCVYDVEIESCPEGIREFNNGRAIFSYTKTFSDPDGDGRGNCFEQEMYLRFTPEGREEWNKRNRPNYPPCGTIGYTKTGEEYEILPCIKEDGRVKPKP